MSTTRTSEGLLRIVVVVLGVLVLLPLLMMVFAVPMMMWWGSGMMHGVSPLWGFGMLLVWLVVLVAIGYLVYRLLVGASASESNPALEELRMAYARGDLTDEEFEERRQNLQQNE